MSRPARRVMILIEGFHSHRHSALEARRPREGRALMWRQGSDIVAIASDERLTEVSVPVLDLNDIDAIADFVLMRAAS